MNRGCVIGLMVAMLLLGVGGYFFYNFVNQLADVPAELQPYENLDSVRAQVRNHTAPPTDTAHLAPQHLATLLAVVDSSNALLSNFLASIKGVGSGDDGVMKEVGKGMNLVLQVRLLPLSLRRGVVAALNQQNCSWGEYLWIKERAVAAAGITKADVDSAVRALLRETFTDSTVAQGTMPEGEVAKFYRRTDSLRASGAIDTAEATLLKPYRTALLDRGKLLLLGIEANDEVEAMIEE
ncbi:MAG: hypothetical protein JNJ94_16260 [Chlorobi bacterium]|nr:hypothetical protein [Chlorobiota bacterium]